MSISQKEGISEKGGGPNDSYQELRLREEEEKAVSVYMGSAEHVLIPLW